MTMTMTEFGRKKLRLFARREWETPHKVDRTGVADSNKNAMKFDLCGDVSKYLLFFRGQYILCSFTGRFKGCNTFGLFRSSPNHIALNLSFATSERLCDVTRHPALQKSEISCLTCTAQLCT